MLKNIVEDEDFKIYGKSRDVANKISKILSKLLNEPEVIPKKIALLQ